MNAQQTRAVEEIVPEWIKPQWPAPACIRAYVTTRAGSVNLPPYDGFNTADHVGDELNVVMNNRHILQQYFGWTGQPCWLNQVHGTDVDERLLGVTAESLSRPRPGKTPKIDADACVSNVLNTPCAIHTADCLPVFFTNEKGSRVALAHAGWRGLLQGVLENTLACFEPGEFVYAWLGPAISQEHFEVGEEVFQQFVSRDVVDERAFAAVGNGKYLCDLYDIARRRLESVGRCAVYGGEYCTFSDPRFFSYRQEPVTGRLLSLIWIDSSQ
ncbi:hypothetical protein A9Q81_25980 [Gammaproteobacteria bacterium 42_54_T18]|nr:hypothetical protein A9Q81_25980 [Gammaproteobacteria bacterium 42_54_T18]